jgi:hypothetical protein
MAVSFYLRNVFQRLYDSPIVRKLSLTNADPMKKARVKRALSFLASHR